MKCVCDKTEAFGYTCKGCSKLTGPATDEDAEKKALEFAKKLNMTLNKEKEAAEDDGRKGEERVQTYTDARVAEIDKALAEKESELMEI